MIPKGTRTINLLNNFDNFQYPSISYNYITESTKQLEANIFLVPKKNIHLGLAWT